MAGSTERAAEIVRYEVILSATLPKSLNVVEHDQDLAHVEESAAKYEARLIGCLEAGRNGVDDRTLVRSYSGNPTVRAVL